MARLYVLAGTATATLLGLMIWLVIETPSGSPPRG
jgi:hypothetical protein